MLQLVTVYNLQLQNAPYLFVLQNFKPSKKYSQFFTVFRQLINLINYRATRTYVHQPTTRNCNYRSYSTLLPVQAHLLR